MQIDPKKCVACGNCVAVCPMGAIYIDRGTNRAVVNTTECVECYNCFRGMSMEHLNPVVVRSIRRLLGLVRLRFDPEPDVCPTSAITPDELVWPRTVRRAFSDVTATHESTGIHGRGTEEVKTNDVTNRLGLGAVGLTVELGRPGVGVWFRDVEHVTKSLATAGVSFESKNPVTAMMVEGGQGRLNPEILDEKVMSVIVEFTTPEADILRVLELLKRVATEIPTIMALGISVRCDETGHADIEQVLADNGFAPLRAKTNLGLGRAESAPVPSA
ncbi:MAG: 4Fe-4S binding protein [Gemmatimonadetes bacterium]|nr:4Fe-4S binding protein [Gemmatimonadota bacterium]